MSATADPEPTLEEVARLEDEELVAELDREYPSPWTPDTEGEQILGEVIEVQESVYTRHGNVPVVTLQGRSGQRKSVWLVHTVLRNEFIRARVLVGERVAIRYLGPTSGEGDTYENYKLAVKRDGTNAIQPDWDRIAMIHNPSLARNRDATPPRQTQPQMPGADDEDIPF